MPLSERMRNMLRLEPVVKEKPLKPEVIPKFPNFAKYLQLTKGLSAGQIYGLYVVPKVQTLDHFYVDTEGVGQWVEKFYAQLAEEKIAKSPVAKKKVKPKQAGLRNRNGKHAKAGRAMAQQLCHVWSDRVRVVLSLRQHQLRLQPKSWAQRPPRNNRCPGTATTTRST